MKASSLLASLLVPGVLCRLSSDPPAKLPPSLLVGYGSWGECDSKMTSAASDGVNVLIWFALNLVASSDGLSPAFVGGPDLSCVAAAKADLAARGVETTHLVSIGGWDAPHLVTDFSAEEVYEAWLAYNVDGLFDGLDWDLEGNDDVQSANNVFTVPCLELMGDFSTLLHGAGFVVSMAPPESYLDVTTPDFSRYVNLTYPEYPDWHADFSYHGRNVYAYLLYKWPEAFDFISVQLYESYAHADYNVSVAAQPAADYLVDYVRSFSPPGAERGAGFTVDFGQDPSLGQVGLGFVPVPLEKLVIGIGNGWVDGVKQVNITADEAGEAWDRLGQEGRKFRGYMFWDIADEGLNGVYLTKGLNKYMHTRP